MKRANHLIHIGFPKSASNYLRQWFLAHPQMGYAAGGIAGFHDIYQLVRAGATTLPEPFCFVTSSESLVFPHSGVGRDLLDINNLLAQPVRASQEAACSLLADLFPQGRILIVTRGYKGLSLSSYSQYIREGGDSDYKSFSKTFATADTLWNYEAVIGIYRAAFGDANVIVLPYELLMDNPLQFFHAITQPLGLSDGPPLVGRPNPSLSGIELAWYMRFSRALRSVGLPKRLERRAIRYYASLSSRNALAGLIRALNRGFPTSPVSADDLADEDIAAWVTPSRALRDSPNYANYFQEYFLERIR